MSAWTEKEVVNVTITGGAGNIANHLITEVLNGVTPNRDAVVNLRLLDIEPAMGTLEGVAMEIDDMAHPNLGNLDITSDLEVAFDGVDLAFLVGAKPRGRGMERSDLLEANAGIFVNQGAAINVCAGKDVRVIVVGNPANSMALVAATNAPDIPIERFSAMTRLDQNRAIGLLSKIIDVPVRDIDGAAIFGNHSDTTMAIDLDNVGYTDRNGIFKYARLEVDQQTLEGIYQKVRKRGSEIIAAKGSSSVPSAAHAAADHARSWLADREAKIASIALFSNGQFDSPAGVFFSMPTVTNNAEPQVIDNWPITERLKREISTTSAELLRERDHLRSLGLMALERS